MTRRRSLALLFCGAPVLLALAAVVPAHAQTPAAARGTSAVTPADLQGVKATPPIRARLWLADRKDMDTALVGVATGKVAYANFDTPTLIQGVIALDTIQRAHFELAIDNGQLGQAERKRDWVGVYRILSAALTPAMPYLSMPDNNAAEQVMQLAGCMMRLAARSERAATTPEERERVAKQYEAAYGVYQQLARADWSPLGSLSVIKGSQCLLKMNKPKTAQFYLSEMTEPMPGDAAYGSYWLTQGMLAAQRGDTRAAMDAAVLSVDFENKDIESFPDALLLSARCYEELQEWHRARDVYFEVATVFPRTDWATVAIERLKPIMASGSTKEKEESPIENVFFKTGDDMNKLVEALFQEVEKATADDADGDETPAARPKTAPPAE